MDIISFHMHYYHRPSAAEALKHKWLQEQLGPQKQSSLASLSHRGTRGAVYAKYLAMKKLKKAALGYIAANLTQQEVGALEDAFRALDKNGDGYITLTELDDAIDQGNFLPAC